LSRAFCHPALRTWLSALRAEPKIPPKTLSAMPSTLSAVPVA
jgi:hypothetical protein